MTNEKRRKRDGREYVYIVLIFCIALVAGIVIVILENVDFKQTRYISSEYSIDDESAKKDSLYIECTISKPWNDEIGHKGAQYDLVVYNKGDEKITDWKIVVNSDNFYNLDNGWNDHS